LSSAQPQSHNASAANANNRFNADLSLQSFELQTKIVPYLVVVVLRNGICLRFCREQFGEKWA
jgi:hypothetical protein